MHNFPSYPAKRQTSERRNGTRRITSSMHVITNSTPLSHMPVRETISLISDRHYRSYVLQLGMVQRLPSLPGPVLAEHFWGPPS